MENTVGNQRDSKDAKGQAENKIAPVGGPIATTIPEPPPPPTENNNTKEKRRWTNDPAMFWVTLAGVVAVVAYTSVAAWQACLTNMQLGEMKTTSGLMKSQLGEMKSSGQQTDSLIAAANSSAKTANDTLVKAQRPFVYQKSVWWRAFVKDDKKAWRGIIEWENSGLTPTRVQTQLIQYATMAARWTVAKKFLASLS